MLLFAPQTYFPASTTHNPKLRYLNLNHHFRPNIPFLSEALLPPLTNFKKHSSSQISKQDNTINASLLETPVLWVGRVCIFYALLKTGLAGSQANPFLSEVESGVDDLGFAKWFDSLHGNPEKEAAYKRKLVSKWHPTTKGTLRRNYRVPSKSEGRRLLNAVASLLSDDDHFVDATSHKL